MTPEEAKPHTDISDVIKSLTVTVAVPSYVSGTYTGEIEPFFTAKETAEIARAYATAFYKEQRCEETGVKGMGENAPKWRELFKEWSK